MASTSEDLRRRLSARLDHLPVLPTAVAALMTLQPSSDSYFDDVLAILESEPNFGARIMIAANSAESAPSKPVTTLSAAVTRIGSRSAAELVLALSVTRVFVPRDSWERSLWRHGIQVAHAARSLAAHAGPDLDPDEVFVCALLHDLGRFVMFQEAPDSLRAVDEGDWSSPSELIEAETAICGLTHPELGAMACTKWGLPDVITEVVRRHHDPTPSVAVGRVDKTIAVVRLADLVMFPSAVVGESFEGRRAALDAVVDDVGDVLQSFLALDADGVRRLALEAEAAANHACETLGIAE